ncbi:MAG: hypothetical protein FJW94_01780 [Actinobacteria bacterium]|nr:hypothetical protein [Actinomycetota bacterium]
MPSSPVDASGVEPNPAARRVVRSLQLAVAALVGAIVALPALATLTGLRDGLLINGDEAVAAMLPLEFVRNGPAILFPGNSYQGVLETPVYALLWWVFGPTAIPARLFHQLVWLAALGVWTWVATDLLRRTGRSLVAQWWGALSVTGLIGLSSVVGWPVFYRIYPGYQLGALLSGVAVAVALRSTSVWHWVAAGFFAGAALYAQPMHLAAVVAVGVAALGWSGSVVSRPVRVTAAAVGGVVGLSPLLLWNLRNSFATFSSDAQPVEHPEWGYVDRLANTLRITYRVISGDASLDPPSWWSPLQVVVVAVVVVLCLIGAVALVRVGRPAAPLLAAGAVLLLGLPLLPALSLEVDYRYAVAWWPAIAVLVAVGAATVVDLRPPIRTVGIVAIGAALLLHAVVVVDGARRLLVEPSGDAGSAETLTLDLAEDLLRCGVTSVAGDYWAVYPVVWGSGATLDGEVFFGPDRLDSVNPVDRRGPGRLAVLPPPAAADPLNAARAIDVATGGGRSDWLVATHPGTGVVAVLERPAGPFPDGCTGPAGLVPSTG